MSSIITRLGRSEWAANQTSPHVPVNEGIAFAVVLSTVLKGKDVDTPPGSPAEGDGYIVGSAPTGAWSAFTAKNLAVYHNGAWIEVTAIDQLRAYVNTGSGRTDVWEFDGADWQRILVGGVKPYDVPVVGGDSPPGVSEVLARFTLARAIEFPADFAGAQGTVETNPAASFAIDVQDDGTSIGTVTITTGGAFSFSTTSNEAKTVAAGSKLEFIAPDPADASVAGISFMLRATTEDV